MEENLNEYSESYEKGFKFHEESQWYHEKYTELVCSTIRAQHLKKVLSLGIGHRITSRALIQLLRQTIDVYEIIEGSNDVIDKFKEQVPTSEVKIHHAFFEDFETEFKYSAIEMGFVLEHVDAPDFILTKFSKLLEPDGVIFIAVPNAMSLHRLLGNKAGLLDDLYELSAYDLKLGHKRYFDIEKLRKLVTKSNLQIQKEQGLLLKPITAGQMNSLEWGENMYRALIDIGLKYPEISNSIYLEAKLQG